MRRAVVLGALLAGLCGAVAGQGSGQSVQFAGNMGTKALLVIDGQTRMLAVGESHAGVKLLSLTDGVARVERNGGITALRIGGAPAALGGSLKSGGGREIVVSASTGGHFITTGAINGSTVQFMVDTGATSVALSQAQAERLGLDWRKGQRALTSTANGAVPVHLLMLRSVRVGDVEVANVSAVVLPAQMPYVLLGNSFLTRFQMRRENDVMRLELRP
ncbi:MAG TPA: retropepsin-like aspartic protease [Rubrivivax sp.]